MRKRRGSALGSILLAAVMASSAVASPAHKDRAFTGFFRQTNGWSAGDGAISVPLRDGRVVWLFGDSYIDQFDPRTGTLPAIFDARNALLVQPAKDLLRRQTLRNPDGSRSFFHPPLLRHGEPWPCFWPGAGFESGAALYVFLFEMEKTAAGGQLGFTNVANYLAKVSLPDLRVIRYIPLPSQNGIGFWCGFIEEPAQRITYAFGNKQHGLGSDVYLARFPTAAPEQPWTFWDGSSWTRDAGRAAVIAEGSSYSVQVCRIREKFVLTSTAFSVACDQGKDIYMSISDRPAGPFSRRQKVFTIDDTVDGHFPFFYSAAAHPEFINAAGEVLVTYCINGYEPCLPNVVNGRMNPDYYRPRAIRVPLDSIGLPKESLRENH